jgi:hypothetical protein
MEGVLIVLLNTNKHTRFIYVKVLQALGHGVWPSGALVLESVSLVLYVNEG